MCNFCLICLLDASASYVNTDISPSYQVAVANLVHGLASGVSTTTTVATSTTTPATTKTATTTTTKIATTTTTKTATATATPTNTPITCVKDGQSCSIEGQLACSGNSFAMCDHGVWGLRGCPSGLTCFSTTDGASVYCGQGSNSMTCASISALTTTRKVLSTPVVKKVIGPSAKPYKGGHVTAQFSVTDSDAGSFSALINVRRLDKKSFGKIVTAQFKVANNIKITSVQNGSVIQKGNQVKIQFKNKKKTMMAVIEMNGQIKGGIFVAPKVNTMKFY